MRWRSSILILFLSVSLTASFTRAHAAFVDEIKGKIDQKTSEIAALEAEIAQYEKEADKAGKDITTLKSTLTDLTLTKRRLEAQLKLTQKQVEQTTLTIHDLSTQIGDHAARLNSHVEGLRALLGEVHLVESHSPIEIILSASDTLSAVSDQVFASEHAQGEILDRMRLLRDEKSALESTRAKRNAEKKNLVVLTNRLTDQRKLVTSTTKETNTLLSATKNKESNYKALIADRTARKQAFEAELNSYESQLRVTIDPSTLPPPRTGVLAWPLQNLVVTQPFGLTSFALRNPQVYRGRGHNGVDFRASIGTPLFSAGEGKVRGTGDTDIACEGASYGRWILIDHGDGLSTLYAHLSLIKVQEGEHIESGTLIGYTGKTGYATGPHLHFAVFATQGVSIGPLKSTVRGCGVYILPRASYNSYLNPMSYL